MGTIKAGVVEFQLLSRALLAATCMQLSLHAEGVWVQSSVLTATQEL